MMNQVWKFPIRPSTQVQEISMPEGAVVLTVQVQRGEVQMWALCDPTKASELRRFMLIGTGWTFDTRGWRYISTIQTQAGELVFHAFEVV